MTPEQAHTVAEIRNRNYFQTTRGTAINKLLSDKQELIQIIDSQAAEIESLKNGKAIGSLSHKIVTLEVEIERLKKEIDARPLTQQEIDEMREAISEI